jgi:hypothetical protein
LKDQGDEQEESAHAQNSSSSIRCGTSLGHCLVDWYSTREAPTTFKVACPHTTKYQVISARVEITELKFPLSSSFL